MSEDMHREWRPEAPLIRPDDFKDEDAWDTELSSYVAVLEPLRPNDEFEEVLVFGADVEDAWENARHIHGDRVREVRSNIDTE